MNILNTLRAQVQPVRSLNRPARLFLLALLLDGLLFSGWNLFFNFYILQAGFDRQFLGIVNAVPSLAALILVVPMGLLSDRMGRKPAMIVGFVVANFALLAMATMRQPAVVVAAAFVMGFSGQLYGISHAPFMMKVSDDKSRDLLFSLSYGMFPFASFVGNAVAGQLPGLFTRLLDPADGAMVYRAVLLTSVLSSFLVLVPIALIREPKKAVKEASVDDPQVPKTKLWRALLRPQTLKLSLPNLLIGFGAATLIPYMNIFFAERYHLNDATLGMLFSVGSLFTGLACFVGPRLVVRMGHKMRVVLLGQSISLVFLLLIGFSPWAWLAVIGFLARGALMNMVAPLFDSYALEKSDEAEHGAVNSVRNFALNVGWAIGPYVSGIVQEQYGFSPLFINTAVLYALAVGFTWLFFYRRKSVQPAVALEAV